MDSFRSEREIFAGKISDCKALSRNVFFARVQKDTGEACEFAIKKLDMQLAGSANEVEMNRHFASRDNLVSCQGVYLSQAQCTPADPQWVPGDSLDNCRANSNLYNIVMEYLPRDLNSLFIGGKLALSLKEQYVLLAGSTKGLSIMHGQNIAHGNINFTTIRIQETADGKFLPRIGNFSTAKLLDPEKAEHHPLEALTLKMHDIYKLAICHLAILRGLRTEPASFDIMSALAKDYLSACPANLYANIGNGREISPRYLARLNVLCFDRKIPDAEKLHSLLSFENIAEAEAMNPWKAVGNMNLVWGDTARNSVF